MGATLSALTVDGDDTIDLATVVAPDARCLFDATTAANTAINVAGSASVSAHLRLQELFAASAVVYDSRGDATRLLERDDWAEVACREGGEMAERIRFCGQPGHAVAVAVLRGLEVDGGGIPPR
ncbi:hypothetical protein MMPV_004739 [Pyropia vietnamensis]